MNDKKVSVSLRMGIKDVQMMDGYLMEHPEFENVSHFIRTAVAKYIRGDAESTLPEKAGSGLYVRLSKMEKAAIDLALETGPYVDGEDFLRYSLRKAIAPNIDEQNGNLLEMAQKLLV